MLSRRGLLGAFAVAPVTAPTAISEIVSGTLASSGAVNVPSGDCVTPGPRRCNSWEVSDHISFRWRHEAEIGTFTVHPSITEKRSWSKAFKAHVHAERAIEMRDLDRRLQQNEKLVEAMAKALGIWPGE